MHKFGKIVVVSMMILLAFFGIASAAATLDPTGAGIVPVPLTGNLRCDELIGFQAGDSLAWIEVDAIQNSLNDGYEPFVTSLGTIYIDAKTGPNGQYFDWYTVGFAPEIITVHGSNTKMVYDYGTTAAIEMSDTLLHAAVPGQSSSWADLSNIEVCGGQMEAPEFPAVALPVGMLIGFLGLVLYIRGVREN